MKLKSLLIPVFILFLSIGINSCDLFKNNQNKNPDGEDPDETGYVFDMDEYLTEFARREDYLVDYYVRYHSNNFSPKFGFGISAVKFKLYEETQDERYLTEALTQTRKCFENYARGTDVFGVYNAAFHYGLFSKYYTEDLEEYARECMIAATAYSDRPSTTNHALMAAVGRYLVSEYFPEADITEYYGYDDPQTSDPTGLNTIKGILKGYPITGVYEYNSDTYFACHYFPLMAIGLCSKNEALAKEAMMVIENALFTMAPVWLKGHLAAASERTYMPYAGQNYGGLSTLLLWYYFGGDEKQYPNKAELDFMEGNGIGFALYSDFMPHWIALAMANDRDETYHHKELHYYNKTRWQTAFVTYMQTYMNKKYAVFSSKTEIRSSQLTYTGAYNGYYRQVLNWAARWVRDNPSDRSTFSIQNVSNIDTSRNIKFGTTPYEQVLQHNGSVIGVFDVPEDHEYPGLLIYQPDNYVAIIDESYLGRMYVHYETVIIAYALSIPFVLMIEDNKIRTNPVTKAYFACEVIDSSDIEGETPEEQLLYVQSLLEGNFKNIKSDLTGKPWIEYVALDGTVMSLQYGGDEQNSNETINGEPVTYDLETYPVQSNPWVTQKWPENVITYTYKDHSITFDFEKKEIIEE